MSNSSALSIVILTEDPFECEPSTELCRFVYNAYLMGNMDATSDITIAIDTDIKTDSVGIPLDSGIEDMFSSNYIPK